MIILIIFTLCTIIQSAWLTHYWVLLPNGKWLMLLTVVLFILFTINEWYGYFTFYKDRKKALKYADKQIKEVEDLIQAEMKKQHLNN